MTGRLSSWLRKLTEDRGSVEKCLECRSWFFSKDPGAWTSYRDFPELCNSMCSRDRRSHTNCRGCGPYCPECAARIEGELLALREAYGR
jgi:hypothetical protein